MELWVFMLIKTYGPEGSEAVEIKGETASTGSAISSMYAFAWSFLGAGKSNSPENSAEESETNSPEESLVSNATWSFKRPTSSASKAAPAEQGK
eukprot:2490427-Pyramimonas_sp.AAC.1